MDPMNRIISFTQEELDQAAEFARQSAPHTHNRRAVSSSTQERDNRIGKLGELAFARFLQQNGKRTAGSEDMLTVWNSIYEVDKTDFQTDDGRTIDIKTASRNFHRRILVPHDQFENQPKDFYVGVRIDENSRTAEIIGFISWQEMKTDGPQSRSGYTYPAYDCPLSDLHPIETLLRKIADSQP